MNNSDLRRILLAHVALILLIVLSFYFDAEIVSLIPFLRNEILTSFFMGITFVSSILIIFLFLTLLFIKEKKRKFLVPLWASLFFSTLIGFILKISISRLRPYQQDLISVVSGAVESSHVIWNYSFPSFQAMMVFSAIPFLSKEFPRFKYVWIVFACLVAFSRVYLGVHFLSDVITGAFLGYLIGYFFLRLKEKK